MLPEEYAEIAKTLIGRKIIEVLKSKGTPGFNKEDEIVSVEYTLDDGRVLRAAATDGGCSCGNGDWDISAPDVVGDAVITGVNAVEHLNDEHSQHGDGEATLRLFIYQDTVATEIVTSSGYDNGYYGWGYFLDVVA